MVEGQVTRARDGAEGMVRVEPSGSQNAWWLRLNGLEEEDPFPYIGPFENKEAAMRAAVRMRRWLRYAIKRDRARRAKR